MKDLYYEAGLRALAHDGCSCIVGLWAHPGGGGACWPDAASHTLPVKIACATRSFKWQSFYKENKNKWNRWKNYAQQRWIDMINV